MSRMTNDLLLSLMVVDFNNHFKTMQFFHPLIPEDVQVFGGVFLVLSCKLSQDMQLDGIFPMQVF